MSSKRLTALIVVATLGYYGFMVYHYVRLSLPHPPPPAPHVAPDTRPAPQPPKRRRPFRDAAEEF